MGYQIDIDTLKCRESPEVLWQELSKTMAGGQKALNFFWEEDWDYFEFVVTGTDRLHHFLWNAYEDPAHPSHQNFLDYYRQIDRLIGKIVAAYRKLTSGYDGFYILSDHGFTGIDQEVYLNAWLEKNGYLRFPKPAPEALEDIHGRHPGLRPRPQPDLSQLSRTGSPRAPSSGRPGRPSRRRSPGSWPSSSTRAARSSARSSSPRTSIPARTPPRGRTSSSSANRDST